MTGPLLLAIDAGTGSCRALLFTPGGEQVAVSLREWTHREPPGVPGGQDFDVHADWPLITACIRDALRQAGGTGDDVAAVAATSMREGIVLYDGAGQEIWACPNVDSRSAREAEELIADGAAERIYAEAGDWVSITSPARLRWLAARRPDIFGAIRGLGMISDWIVYRLSGVRVTEPSCGSSSGMFRLPARNWSEDIARTCGIPPEVLPEVVDPGTVVGAVTPAAAEQTGLRAGTPVVAGGADTQLGLAGAGKAACIRAIEEAAAYVVRGHLEIITGLTGTAFTELTFSGGGARGTLWPQIIADVTALPVHVPAVTESSALGAALCAAVGAGLHSSLTELEPLLRGRAATFEPGQAAVSAYHDGYAAWQQIYARMLDLSDEGLLTPLWRAAGA